MKWINYDVKKPPKEKFTRYEMVIESDTDNFGKQTAEIMIFWDDLKWNLCDKYSLVESFELPENYFDLNKPLVWREYRASNLVD
jgi:hypothetical protein